MLIFINERTIAEFDLEKITGKTREELLEKARQAELEGFNLSMTVDIRESPEIAHNVFEAFHGVPAEGHDEFRTDIKPAETPTDVSGDIVDAEIVEETIVHRVSLRCPKCGTASFGVKLIEGVTYSCHECGNEFSFQEGQDE